MERKSFFEKVARDAVMMGAMIISSIFIILTLILPVATGVIELAFVYTPIAFVGVIVLLRRNRVINDILDEGYSMNATIDKIVTFSKNPKVVVRYTYDTQEYRKSIYVNNRRVLQSMQVGDTTKILINPNKPSKILLQELYN